VKEAAEPTRQQAGLPGQTPAAPAKDVPAKDAKAAKAAPAKAAKAAKAAPAKDAGSKDTGPKDAVSKDAGGSASRLGWLDVLRGVAALAVVFDHVSYYTLQHVRQLIYQWFDPGNYGVFVFFLISGYIVPASLERKGSVRTFWVSRVFRLYPLYLLAVGVAVAFYLTNVGSARGEASDPVGSFLSQFLMMSNVISGQNLPNVVWSLSYEMIFYLLLTALFIARVHKRSSWYALAFAAAAVAIGGLLPRHYLVGNLAPLRLVALITDLVVLAGLAFAVVMRGMSRLLGAALAAVVAVALLAFNGGWIWPWEALSILALMFTGTMFYRAEQGQYPWRKAIAIGVTVLGLALVAGLWHSRAWGMSAHAELLWSRRWVTAFGLAGLTFAAGLAFRRRVRWPRALTWLGLISYSVYLLHPLVIAAYHHWYPSRQHHFYLQVLIATGLLVIVIALSSATYLFVERPMQGVGRRVGRWMDARFGSDRAPGPVPAERRPAMAGRGQPATELPDTELPEPE
jgi:peptidoglycan/LPS O-acetylase OafA/YrhL